jgi:hypothetical protein
MILLAGIMNLNVIDIIHKHKSEIEASVHTKVGLICFDENKNVHFTCEEDIKKMH